MRSKTKKERCCNIGTDKNQAECFGQRSKSFVDQPVLTIQISLSLSQIYKGDPKTWAIFYPGLGLKLGVFGFFP